MNWRAILLFLISCTGVVFSHAQNRMAVELAGGRGFLLPHRQNMMHLPETAAQMIEARVTHVTDGSELWQQNYNGPEYGITVRGFDLANEKLLGYGVGAAAYFSAPVIATDKFRWHLEMGAGPGYTTKKFDYEENYQNIAIGSHFNAFIMLGQRFSYALNERLHVTLQTSFNHFSNAAFSLPNLGLNYPVAALGLRYGPSFYKLDDKSTQFDKIESKWTIGFGAGYKQVTRPFLHRGPTFQLGAERSFGLSAKSSISLGTDIFYNSALYANRNSGDEWVHPFDNIQIGLRVGYALHVDRMTFIVQKGVYALDSYKRDGAMYHRVGFRYQLNDLIAASLCLKTHFFKADFFELGTSFSF